jgi:hypothetical protein
VHKVAGCAVAGVEQPQLDIATRNIIPRFDQVKFVCCLTGTAWKIIGRRGDIHPRRRGVIPLLKFYDMRRITFIPALDVKVHIRAGNVIVYSKLEIVGKAAAGRWIDIRSRNFGQNQFGGAALKVHVFERTG